jgi:hypothetical protein
VRPGAARLVEVAGYRQARIHLGQARSSVGRDERSEKTAGPRRRWAARGPRWAGGDECWAARG